MALKALSYIALETSRMDEWHTLSTRLLGLQETDRSSTTAAYRMDNQRQRLMFTHGSREGKAVLGLECDSLQDLDTFARRIESRGLRVDRGSQAHIEQRQVGDLITFDDPQGNKLEICWKPVELSDPFVPGRPISGFLTGSLGMGHAVIHVQDANLLLPFYQDVLGFGLSDYGLQPYPVYFLHLNSRHHSLAMVGSGRTGLHHFMLELTHLDDVGQGYDLAQLEPDRVAYTLGRHSNDYMTSFYLKSPSDFLVEYGWGGRTIDPALWKPHETFDGPSFWGHDRLAFPPELRQRFRELCLDAAARGLRAQPELHSSNTNNGVQS